MSLKAVAQNHLYWPTVETRCPIFCFCFRLQSVPRKYTHIYIYIYIGSRKYKSRRARQRPLRNDNNIIVCKTFDKV